MDYPKVSARDEFTRQTIGKNVTVHLNSGKTVSGTLRSLDDSGITLTTSCKNLYSSKNFIPASAYEYVSTSEND